MSETTNYEETRTKKEILREQRRKQLVNKLLSYNSFSSRCELLENALQHTIYIPMVILLQIAHYTWNNIFADPKYCFNTFNDPKLSFNTFADTELCSTAVASQEYEDCYVYNKDVIYDHDNVPTDKVKYYIMICGRNFNKFISISPNENIIIPRDNIIDVRKFRDESYHHFRSRAMILKESDLKFIAWTIKSKDGKIDSIYSDSNGYNDDQIEQLKKRYPPEFVLNSENPDF